jgi:hypothetical protein
MTLVASAPQGLNISDETLAYARSLRPWRSEFSFS